MSPPRQMVLPRHLTVAALTRLFALAAIGIPSFAVGDPAALMAVVLFAVVWAGSTTISLIRRLPAFLGLAAEAAAIAFVCAVSVEHLDALHLAALAIPPLIGGLRVGAQGVAVSLVAQLAMLAICFAGFGQGWDGDVAIRLFFGLMLGLGFGLLATFQYVTRGGSDPLTPYRDARVLIQQLLDLSEDLSAGLDPVSIAEEVSAQVKRGAAVESAVVSVRSGDEFAPLLASPAVAMGKAAADPVAEDLLAEAWRAGRPLVDGDRFALPLATDAGVVGVVAGVAAGGGDARTLTEDLVALDGELTASALRLDTALLFSAVRDRATSQERQRLAREVHDGVAQEVVSLGYLVDALADSTHDEAQGQQLRLLRDAISRVVGEIRRTVYDLRTEDSTRRTLGERLTELATRTSTTAGIAVEVAIDEQGPPLRPELAHELFRIVQEALHNAVKHAECDRVIIDGVIDGAVARLRIRDDGRGLQAGRDDSHGLRIMTERARRIGGRLDVASEPGRGVTVTVTLGSAEKQSEPTTPTG